MKLHLHIGLPKAGSTTIQNMLTANAQAFANNGFFVSEDVGLGHRKLSLGYRKNWTSIKRLVHGDPEDEKVRQKLRASYWDSIDANLQDGEFEGWLYSDEGLSTVTLADLKQLSKDMNQRFSSISIILYIRSQLDLIVSAYSTRLRSNDYQGTLEEHIEERLQDPESYEMLYLDRFITKWESEFPEANFKIRILDRKFLESGDLVSDYLRVVGLDESFREELKYDESSNSGLNAVGAEFLRQTNKILPLNIDGKKNHQRGDLQSIITKSYPGRVALPPLSVAKKIVDHFQESNEVIRKKYFPDRPALFDARLERFAEDEGEHLSFQDAVEVGVTLWRVAQNRNASLLVTTRLLECVNEILSDDGDKAFKSLELLQQDVAQISQKDGLRIRKVLKQARDRYEPPLLTRYMIPKIQQVYRNLAKGT